MAHNDGTKFLWKPDPEKLKKTQLTLFGNKAAQKYGFQMDDYESLHRWSIERPEQFWEEVWNDAQVIYSKSYTRVMGPAKMPGTKWFEGTKLNYAENLLERGGDEDAAIRFTGETGKKTVWTRKELKSAVARCTTGLKDAGVQKGIVLRQLSPTARKPSLGSLQLHPWGQSGHPVLLILGPAAFMTVWDKSNQKF